MRWRRPPLSAYDELRLQFLCETERTLAYALAHPEEFPRIPAVEVGKGRFSRVFAEQFWADVLAS